MPMPTDRGLLASRVREVRRELFGDEAGVAPLARALGIPPETWENAEQGVSICDLVLLRFLAHTGAEPHWLLTGEGERFRIPTAPEGGQTSV